MKTDRVVFNDFPMISSDEPLVSDPFYSWLKDTETFKEANQRTSRHNNFFESLDLYLSTSYGWDVKKHKLTAETIQTLEYVFDIYLRMFTPVRDTELNNLLRPTDDKEAGFWLRGQDNPSKFKPTALLRHGLHDMGLVYEIKPEYYYFEIINGYLFIKYQHIIGSRRLCKLTDQKVAT